MRNTTSACIVLLLFALAPLARGQVLASAEPQAAAPLVVPAPAALSADWWGYFEDAPPGEFPARAEAFQQVLDEVAAGLRGGGRQACPR